MIDISYIKEQLAKKAIDNRHNGKVYKIDFEKKCIIKTRPNRNCNLELDCMKYLCEQYYKLGIDFRYEITNEYVSISTPFLDVLKEDTLFTQNEIIKNTSTFLQNFSEQNIFYKDLLVDNNLQIHTYQDNWDPRNYFLWNNEIYLLDLESFYFTIQTKEGIDIGKYGICEDKLEKIHNYQMPKDIEYMLGNKDWHMLVY